MRILLVDDERLALGVMAGGLRSRGLAVTEANSAQQALALWREQSFDVLLTDIAMPGMNGLELAQQIGATQEAGDLAPRMVALTGNYACHQDETNLSQTFDLILSKPITVAAVARQLDLLPRGGSRPH